MRDYLLSKLRAGPVKYWDLKLGLAKVMGCRFGGVFMLCTDQQEFLVI